MGVTPKARQRKAFDYYRKNGGDLSKAMIAAGYAKTSAKNPGEALTSSIGWKMLMAQYLPDDLLAQRHNDLLNTPKKMTIKKYGKVIQMTEELDSNAVAKGLDMAYKIKGFYKADNDQKAPTVIVNIERKAAIKKALEDI